MRVAIYLRAPGAASTLPGVTTQERELRAACGARGWTVTTIHRDGAGSAAGERPGFASLRAAVLAGDVDVVAAASVERLGRGLQQVVLFADDLRAAKVALFIPAEGIDTTAPGGDAVMHAMGVLAQYQRDFLRVRSRAGVEEAREGGISMGRPRSDKEGEIRRMLSAGMSTGQIRARTGAGISTITRVRREVNACGPSLSLLEASSP